MLNTNKSNKIEYEKESGNNVNNVSYNEDIGNLQMEKFYIMAFNKSNHLNNQQTLGYSNSVKLSEIDNSKEKVTLKDNNSKAELSNSNSEVFKSTDKVNKNFENQASTKDDASSRDNDYSAGKSVSVFKVEKDKITSEITETEKSKLLLISRKLSPFDYFRIYNFLKSDDSEKGVKDSMVLLKARLSVADYGKVKDVLKRFLNMAIIAK